MRERYAEKIKENLKHYKKFLETVRNLLQQYSVDLKTSDFIET